MTVRQFPRELPSPFQSEASALALPMRGRPLIPGCRIAIEKQPVAIQHGEFEDPAVLGDLR
jgi:hypothetical protein